MPVEWKDDGSPADQFQIEHNLDWLIQHLKDTAHLRAMPTIEMAHGWHRQTYLQVTVPVPYFVGGIRDSDPEEPELVDYSVGVRGPTGAVIPGVPAAQVPGQLRTFQRSVQDRIEELDRLIPARGPLLQHADKVLETCAFTHGEWVRIHPFVNGNGRIARIWANWCALRYGLPDFVRLRPRPQGDGYAFAAEQSMFGNHAYMQIEMTRMLTVSIQRTGPA